MITGDESVPFDVSNGIHALLCGNNAQLTCQQGNFIT